MPIGEWISIESSSYSGEYHLLGELVKHTISLGKKIILLIKAESADALEAISKEIDRDLWPKNIIVVVTPTENMYETMAPYFAPDEFYLMT